MSCASFAEHRRVLADLRELITALDTRIPQPQRSCERDIVVDAKHLKHAASVRIKMIERLLAGPCAHHEGSIRPL